jgi:indolepyruvate ferredoxin oxidoreductase beta subunit
LLRFLGILKPYRRALYRHQEEQAHLSKLLGTAAGYVKEDYALAVEILACQRLVKGYSDTHARSHSKFAKVLDAAQILHGREDASDWISRLRAAALKDEAGQELDGAIKTVRSFTNTAEPAA